MERPHWNIVLIGSAHGSPPPAIFKLQHLRNLHFLGVRAYNEIGPYIRNFDVAIMPHISNEISERMNPLKLYVYFAYGVPIVTMDVPNIGEISPYARIARSHDEFIAAVDAALAEGRKEPLSEHKSLIEAISWERRVAEAISLFDNVPRQ
jgi:glycosyltransferase involved in cell wall biosynthesis